MSFANTQLAAGKSSSMTILDMNPLLFIPFTDTNVGVGNSVVSFGTADVSLIYGANWVTSPDPLLTFDSQGSVGGGTTVANITVSAGTESNLQLNGALTFAIWIRCDDWASATIGKPFAAYGGSGESEAANFVYLWRYDISVDRVDLFWETGGGSNRLWNAPAFGYSTEVATHLAVTRTGGDPCKVQHWKDGVKHGSLSPNITQTSGGGDGVFTMAIRQGTALHWAMWDRVLSDTDILELYNVGHLGPQAA